MARFLGCLLVAAGLLLPAYGLPPVILDMECPAVAAFQAPAEQMVAFLASYGGEAPGDYTAADLELGVGDGVPDYYQLMLLGSALCSGDEALNATFAANRAAVANYLHALESLFNLAVKSQADAASASAELEALMAWPSYDLLVPQDIKDYVQQMADGLGVFAENMAMLTNPDNPLRELSAQLDGLTDVIAGAGGLSSEMRRTLLDALDEDVLGDLAAYQAELTAMATTMESVANGLGYLAFFYPQAPDLQASLLALVDDIRAFNTLANTLAAPPALAIYGAAKTETEPFSGLGDYDGDGFSNADAFALVSSRGGDPRAFVKAASGADPFYKSEEAPAAGVIALAGLAGIIAVIGVLVLFRKPTGKPR